MPNTPPVVSPFIPPLFTPGPQGSPNHPQPPVIPSPGGGSAPPPWAHTAQHPGSYPMYPSTPYTSTPFIPTATPAMTPGPIPGGPSGPGGYIPAPPPGPQQHQQRPGNLSLDYTGYPNFQPGPYSAPPYHQHSHPPTPWGPNPTPLQGMGPTWNASRQPYPPFQQPPFQQPPFQQPHFQQSHFQQPPPPAPFPGAAPPHLGGFTPGYSMMNPDLWGLQQPPGIPPHWPQSQMGMPPPGPVNQVPQQGPLGRATAHEGDRVNPFMSGEHYGPVLEPFLIRVVGAQIKINPLLQPVPDDSDRPHLKWNMLFPSSDCQRSTDPSHISWVEGRHEPATFPRVTSLQIVSEALPWAIKVEATRPHIGVTCGDLIDRLSSSLYTLASQSDFDALPTQKSRLVSEAYRHNRSRVPGVPGGMLDRGLRRLDFLGKDTIFGGIDNNEQHIKRICGVVQPCTVILKCLHRYAMTADEIREHEARRAAAEAERRRATVTSDDETDDD